MESLLWVGGAAATYIGAAATYMVVLQPHILVLQPHIWFKGIIRLTSAKIGVGVEVEAELGNMGKYMKIGENYRKWVKIGEEYENW